MAALERADLEARVAQLEDERAVLDTMYRYARAIDYGLDDEWLDCFTADALYDVRFGAQTGVDRSARCVGHAELGAFVAARSHAPEAWYKHLLVEPRVTVDGDTASVDSYFLVLDTSDASPRARTMGRYYDRLVHGEDGRWRFSERIAEVEATRPS